MKTEDIKWDDDKISNPSNSCGGYKGCENRECDNTKTDCQDCISDSEEGIKQALEIDPEEMEEFLTRNPYILPIKERKKGVRAMKTENEIYKRYGVYIFNGSSDPCDNPEGHCSCGAHHTVEDMKHRVRKKRFEDANKIERKKDQATGGTLTIPDGWFVSKVDLDAEEPYCLILPKDFSAPSEEEKKILIPKSLAYFLSKHDNGSDKFRKIIRTNVKNELRSKLKELLEIEKATY